MIKYRIDIKRFFLMCKKETAFSLIEWGVRVETRHSLENMKSKSSAAADSVKGHALQNT